MKTLKQLHSFWKHPNRGNRPEDYMPNINKSEYLFGLIKRLNIPKDTRILEPGCNIGRNLNYLYQHGYHNLAGIEINQDAVKKMRKFYPSSKLWDITFSSVEDIIEKLPSGHYGLVFTMAILEHIHPDSEWVFLQLVRIVSDYLITIEPEKEASRGWRVFPRNYRELFERLGMEEVFEEIWPQEPSYTTRIFRQQHPLHDTAKPPGKQVVDNGR